MNKKSLLILCVASIGAVAWGAPVVVEGPKIITTGEEFSAAGDDGVETSGDIDIDSDAKVVFATDEDSQIILRPGFEASPSGTGKTWLGTLGSGESYDGYTLNEWINISNFDTDGDGMPDEWEIFFGLNPFANDALEDLDGDGITNLAEYNNGVNSTDPMANNSWFTSPAAAGSGYGSNPVLIIDPDGGHHDLNTENLVLD